MTEFEFIERSDSCPRIVKMWVLLEGGPRAIKLKVSLDEVEDLDDFALILTQGISDLGTVDPQKLVFLHNNNILEPNEDVQTLANTVTTKTPLIVRYPISAVNIKVTFVHGHKHGKREIPHNTGSFNFLKTLAKEIFPELGEDIYFVNDGTDIWDAYNFNNVISTAEVDKKNNITLRLTIKIKGKKKYSDWGLTDVFKKILHQPDYKTLEDIPSLEHLPSLKNPFPTSELENFAWELQKDLEAYNKAISTNEMTCRTYINAFMTTAVRHVKVSTKKLIRLCNEIGLEGSHGYGPTDYMVKVNEILVLLCEAKSEDMNQGSAQVLVQMQSAIEQQLRKRKYGQVFGIVTTGKLWRFISWAGSLEEPMIQISEEYTCGYMGKMEVEKEILKYIAQILEAQVKVFCDDDDDDSSRPSKRHCHD